MIVELDGVWYISVKGTAKAYKVNPETIKSQIRNNKDLFINHAIKWEMIQKKWIIRVQNR